MTLACAMIALAFSAGFASADAPSEVAPAEPQPRELVPASDIAIASDEAAPTAETTGESSLVVIKTILGLVAILVLAYAGGHRKALRVQKRLGIASVIAAGFPFVALGLVASLPTIGILTSGVVGELRPVLNFGLGWLGFIIGMQLDIRVLDRVPRGSAYLILLEATAPFALTAAACGAAMIAMGFTTDDPVLWRNAILLGTAAAMTAPRGFRGFANRTWQEGRGADWMLGQLDDLVGVIGLLFITSFFREDPLPVWQLPSTAWVFVSLGIGVTIGVLIFALIRVPRSNAEFLAVVLGGIAFASGFAGYLRLSPIVICFIAGILVTNFPNDHRKSVLRILDHLERPVHLLFLVIAGALWHVDDWRGWVLVPLFVAARFAGKWLGIGAARLSSVVPAELTEGRALATPMSSLAIALVISVENTYADTGLPWVITAVIGGALISELLVQVLTRSQPPPEPTPPLRPRTPPSLPIHREPIDELDEDPR